MTCRVTRSNALLLAGVLAIGCLAAAERAGADAPPGASVPKVAKVLKADLVQAFVPCTAPDTDVHGEPACTGPVPASDWWFGARGRGTLRLKARAVAAAARPPCAPGVTGIVYKVGLQDLRAPDGLPFTDTPGGPPVTLALRARVSHLYGCPDCLTRDCSVADQALDPIPLTCREGTCRASGVVELVGGGVNVELTVVVDDPVGHTLARTGHRIKGGAADAGIPTTWQAKLLHANLVARAAECTAPTALADGMPACRPITRSSYRFGADGWGLVVLKRSGNRGSVKVKLKDVRDGAHAPVTDVFMLTYVDRRTSSAGCTAAPCTRTDTFLGWPVACRSGRCIGTAKIDDPGFEGASIELDAIVVRDPLGLPFAAPGLKTR